MTLKGEITNFDSLRLNDAPDFFRLFVKLKLGALEAECTLKKNKFS